jgi:CheY-like chemotaxis protein
MKRILIVEDDEAGAQVLVDMIQMFFKGWVISHTGSGHGAIERALSEKPDVILLDIALNDEIDGIQVIKAIAKTDLKPRIILNTALGSRASRGPRPGKPWVEQLEEKERALVASFFDKSHIKWADFMTEIAKAADVAVPPGISDL